VAIKISKDTSIVGYDQLQQEMSLLKEVHYLAIENIFLTSLLSKTQK
jgi:hypothetical protein